MKIRHKKLLWNQNKKESEEKKNKVWIEKEEERNTRIGKGK